MTAPKSSAADTTIPVIVSLPSRLRLTGEYPADASCNQRGKCRAVAGLVIAPWPSYDARRGLGTRPGVELDRARRR